MIRLSKDTNEDSILLTVKKLIGPSPYYDEFDADILVHINGAFAYLTRLGCGPSEGFFVTDETQTWDDFIPKSVTQANVKQYVVANVRLIFDTPTGGTLDALKTQIERLEWMINSDVDRGVNKKQN